MDNDTTAVLWREAAHADRAALQGFTCTSPKPTYQPGNAPRHPKVWELQVQGWLRQRRVPVADCFTQLGFVSNELGAVAAFSCTDVPDGPECFIQAAAISTAHRGSKDKTLADAMMAQIEIVTAQHFDALGHTRARLRGKIHVSNQASQNMAKRSGWEPWHDVDEGLRNWVLHLSW